MLTIRISQPLIDSAPGWDRERKTARVGVTSSQGAELALGAQPLAQSLAQLSEPLPSGQPTLHRLELLAAEVSRWNGFFWSSNRQRR